METALELVFSQGCLGPSTEKASKRLSKHYENRSEERNLNVVIDGEKQVMTSKEQSVGWRLMNRDQTEVVVLQDDRLIIGQLAPYPGWEEFSRRVRRDYELLKSEVGFRLPIRVGVRAINRIDVPEASYLSAGPGQFLRCAPPTPPYGTKRIDAFLTQIENGLDDNGNKAKVVVATVFPLVPGTTALLLDIDVFNNSKLPDSDAGIWHLADSLRSYKNEIFESSITDRARQLFL